MSKINLHLLVFAVSAVFALSFGFSFGNVGNQATYLPHALNNFNSEFLKNDWLVGQTTVYHGNFRWILLAFNWLGVIAWGTALLNSTLILFSFYMIYRWHDELHRPSSIYAIILTILFACLDKTRAVGDSYLFSSGLQPSVIATTAWIGAILYFFRERYFHSGIVLALGALFHANFMVLGIGVFTLVHFFLGKQKLFSRWLVQVGPSIVVMLFSLPMLIAVSGGEEAQLAREIFLKIRAPHHYLPSTYSIGFWYLGGWSLGGLSAVYAMHDLPGRRSLLSLIAALAISVAAATILTTLVYIPQVSQLYVWRLAPFLQILSQVCVALFLIRQVTEQSSIEKRQIILVAGFILGIIAILRWVIWSARPSVQSAIVLVLASLYLALWLYRRKQSAGNIEFTKVYCCLVLTVVLGIAITRIESEFGKSTLLHQGSNSLLVWVQKTQRGAVFLIPPELEDFRLLGERAVVVDWKSTPILPKELISWHQRLSLVSGQPVYSFSDAVIGYRKQNLTRLKEVAKKFGADYIVIDNARHIVQIGDAQPVFKNEEYSVYPIESAGLAINLR